MRSLRRPEQHCLALYVEEEGDHGRSKWSGRDLNCPARANERAIEAPSAVVISDPCLAGSSPPPLFTRPSSSGFLRHGVF